ncbi:2-aminoethylphosphonate--pyruvate transaminase [Vallitalea longa]|uniref:2-aminoethylphosphonate--pyruvate transaminase n=1 Tax=Vallitalea longa TaxID=2936439 RepID=A0A9W5Y8D8_9FIRM|nr:2-aminoethylphosphonate--pyruvate transaminase [Vallitalea longa]GKX27731.1 2-aminoethylphosphonate--pyruvate transaminase [Vallitalea longa]
MSICKLLTPGPLSTSDEVKNQMLVDRCTWDNDYKMITQKIRKQLLSVAHLSEEDYTTVLLQGSGSFAVEATLNSAVSQDGKCLFIVNGAYGERMVEMGNRMSLDYSVYRTDYHIIPNVNKVRKLIETDTDITHIAMVHCETTTGILNPIEDMAKLCNDNDITFIVDAMSSFGGIPMDIEKMGIDFLISSANKCIQGVPGFGFVIAKTDKLIGTQGKSSSLVMDLYDQWVVMNKDGKWRYTSPTHVVAAFSKALDELFEEGGVEERYARYCRNNEILRDQLSSFGIKAYITDELQSPIITTFLFPSDRFDFDDFYKYIKERGFIIYPGKLTDEDTFRIGNIEEIYEVDIRRLCKIISTYMEG